MDFIVNGVSISLTDVIPADRAVEVIRELRNGVTVEARGGRVAVRLCQTCDARLV